MFWPSCRQHLLHISEDHGCDRNCGTWEGITVHVFRRFTLLPIQLTLTYTVQLAKSPRATIKCSLSVSGRLLQVIRIDTSLGYYRPDPCANSRRYWGGIVICAGIWSYVPFRSSIDSGKVVAESLDGSFRPYPITVGNRYMFGCIEKRSGMTYLMQLTYKTLKRDALFIHLVNEELERNTLHM